MRSPEGRKQKAECGVGSAECGVRASAAADRAGRRDASGTRTGPAGGTRGKPGQAPECGQATATRAFTPVVHFRGCRIDRAARPEL